MIESDYPAISFFPPFINDDGKRACMVEVEFWPKSKEHADFLRTRFETAFDPNETFLNARQRVLKQVQENLALMAAAQEAMLSLGPELALGPQEPMEEIDISDIFGEAAKKKPST